MPVPRFGMYLGALALFGLAAFIAFAVFDLLLPEKGAWLMPVTWICLGVAVGLASWGAYVVYCAFNFVPALGIHFFELGIELGEGKQRKFIPYSDLELLEFTLVRAPDATDAAFKVARAAISVVALNPAGIGRSLREMTEEAVYSELTIKARGSAVSSFSLTRPVHDTLARVTSMA